MMTDLEKARRYDLAKQRIKEWAEGMYGHSVNDTPKEIAEYVFPELAESEDDRVMRRLSECLNNMWLFGNNVDYSEYSKEEIESWLNWLEKQGEHNTAEPVPIFRVGDVLKRKDKGYTFTVDRIQGGYYFCDHNNGAFTPIEEQDNWELVKQKQWKPTERQIEALTGSIENHCYTPILEELLEQLKALSNE